MEVWVIAAVTWDFFACLVLTVLVICLPIRCIKWCKGIMGER